MAAIKRLSLRADLGPSPDSLETSDRARAFTAPPPGRITPYLNNRKGDDDGITGTCKMFSNGIWRRVRVPSYPLLLRVKSYIKFACGFRTLTERIDPRNVYYLDRGRKPIYVMRNSLWLFYGFFTATTCLRSYISHATIKTLVIGSFIFIFLTPYARATRFFSQYVH